LPVADIAADDCALFLWATDPLLPRAFDLITAWGFEYKTIAFYWVKLNSAAKHNADFFTGLGYWTRANPEDVYLRRAESQRGGRKTSDVSSSKSAVSTVENQIVFGSASNGS